MLEIIPRPRPRRPHRPASRFYGRRYYGPVYQEPIVLEVERTAQTPFRMVISFYKNGKLVKDFTFYGASLQHVSQVANAGNPELDAWRKKRLDERCQIQSWMSNAWVPT